MSGIAGIVAPRDAVVESDLLRDMVETLRFRGPDGLRTWADGQTGLGHAWLNTTDEESEKPQPCSLDGRTWITADVRLDGRAELVRGLEAGGANGAAGCSDAELILFAYSVWGERCVEHLLGDFSFAIWDSARHRLFCARDHFGVKPFYYSHKRGTFVFSNTLAAVRRHPDVSQTLNDLAIADFLLFEGNQELDTTAFADIQRLPPAHTLVWTASSGAAIVRRFWQLSIRKDIRFKTRADYVDRFSELLRAAVTDRLRSRRAAVAMSGGLDSSLVAAVGRQALAEGGQPFDLQAHTVVYDHLIPDEERKYAGLVAETLGIPVNFFPADTYGPFDGCDEPRSALPEPGTLMFRALSVAFHKQVARQSRVLLTGHDADALLGEFASEHLAFLASRGEWKRWGATVLRHALWFRRRPPVGLRAWMRQRSASSSPMRAPLPSWLHPDLAARLGLDDRWHTVRERRRSRQSARPRASACMAWWSQVFEAADAESLGAPIECRYPFADIRLVGYLLAIPVVPWCTDKTLIRLALKGMLPDAIRYRKKAPVSRDQLHVALARGAAVDIDTLEPARALANYIKGDVGAVGGGGVGRDYADFRPAMLNHWLRFGVEHTPEAARGLQGAEDGKRYAFRSRT